MTPVVVVFLVMVAIWGAIGIVRGFRRELGVTLMLLIALFVLTIIDARLSNQVNKVLAFIAGPDPCKQMALKAAIQCLFLIFMVFISYQGEILTFPGSGTNSFVSWLTGLLNGYLFAGSLWYYLAQAGWPFGLVQQPYGAVYDAISKILPPAILTWQVLIALVVIMLILRVLK